MLDPISGQVLTNVSCKTCRQRHPSQWSCQLARDIARREQSIRMFVESFFIRHPEPEIDKLVRWIEEDTIRAAKYMRELKNENMHMLVELSDYGWMTNPDRMGK